MLSKAINPYARPKESRLTPHKRELPPIEDHTGHCRFCDRVHRVNFAVQRGADPTGLEIIGDSVWEITYRCIYPDGVYDDPARFGRFIARSRAEALKALQWQAFGFADKVLVYDISRPYAKG